MTDCLIPLARLRAGQGGTVVKVGVPEGLGRRLLDLGLVAGTEVSCRMRGPGLVALELRGTVLALRASDAAGILCRLEGSL